MHEFRKAFGRSARNALGGTVGTDKFRMLRFEVAKPLHQRIVLAIGDLRTFPQIVEFIMTSDIVAKSVYCPFD